MATIDLKVRPDMGGRFCVQAECSERLAFGVHTLVKIGDQPVAVEGASKEFAAFVAAAQAFLHSSEAYLKTLEVRDGS